MLAVQRFNCERISVFNYAHLPARFPSQRKFEKANVPTIAEKKAMTQQIAKGLSALGYQKIGLDHFAKHDDTLTKALEAGTLSRNFQGYTSDNNDQILGLGVSAISNIGNTRSQNNVDLAYIAKQFHLNIDTYLHNELAQL